MSRLDIGLKYIKIYVALGLRPKNLIYLQLLLRVVLFDRNCPVYNRISGDFQEGGK